MTVCSFEHLFVSFLVLVMVCAKAGLGTTMGCVERERQALLRFRLGLVDDYGILSSWDRSDCCQWRGVRCSNRSGHIIMLSLPAPQSKNTYDYQSLRGELSPSLLELEHLTHLDLSFNDFEGSPIPPFLALLPKIQYLNLSDANFTGRVPSQLGNLSNLHSLHISGYQLHSENLDWISRLSSLRHLDLNSVNLSKAIHWLQAINKLPFLTHLNLQNCRLPPFTTPSLSPVNSSARLAYLDLSANYLTSSIYPWLFNFTTTLVHLDLCSNGYLTGSIPDAFGNMDSLTYLNIEANQLQGSIPEAFGNITSLEELHLDMNKIEGEIPKSLSNLCHLQLLDLAMNNLSGQLSQVLDLLACANNTLESLSLSDNQFTGSVPDLIRFSSLRWLFLSYNQLNGTLPKSIGQLAKLQGLYIASNSLQGVISEAHLHLSQLQYLDLSSNSLTFNMSSEWVPPFKLSGLQLRSCQLGPRFPSWLQTQKNLGDLDISNSSISDVIPDWFWNLTFPILFTLNVSKNQITGTLLNLSSTFDQPLAIDMSSNYLGGSISQIPSSLAWLDLSNNKFSGSISPLCASSQSYLVYLDLSNNSLSGGLPNCWPQWESLKILNLENNQFSGKIPTSFGSLHLIRSLHLRNNNLIGELPLSLKRCKSLSLIDLAKNRLSGNIPSWIGGSISNLIVLSLRSNKFNGSIGLELCQLKKLQILDLSSNNLSGTIPRCLSNFTAMTNKETLSIVYNYDSLQNLRAVAGSWSYVDRDLVKWKGREYEYKNTLGQVKNIDLSSNRLIGEIPKEVINLLELVSLNFSRNNLIGLIPIGIGQLKSLDVLDLSHNQLIGEIPTSLSQINCLSTLDLSYNNLSGKIPQGTQLQSFNASTYEGNPTLCGLPLLKKCPGDRGEGAPNAYSNEDNIQQDGNDIWFYVSIILGFIVGFWGVCGTLLLND